MASRWEDVKLKKDVQKLAGAIADAIEANGHYQDGLTPYASNDKTCCVVVGPYEKAPAHVQDALELALISNEGIEETSRHGHTATIRHGVSIPQWNDAVTTDEVIDALRAIEIG